MRNFRNMYEDSFLEAMAFLEDAPEYQPAVILGVEVPKDSRLEGKHRQALEEAFRKFIEEYHNKFVNAISKKYDENHANEIESKLKGVEERYFSLFKHCTQDRDCTGGDAKLILIFITTPLKKFKFDEVPLQIVPVLVKTGDTIFKYIKTMYPKLPNMERNTSLKDNPMLLLHKMMKELNSQNGNEYFR